MADPEPRWHTNNVPAAKRLRKRLTPTEALVWDVLRDRRYHGLKFRRQHAVGRFVLDFYCDELMLAIEVDGGIHRDPNVAAEDAERQALIEERGIRFVRLSTGDVEKYFGRVGELVSRELGRLEQG